MVRVPCLLALLGLACVPETSGLDRALESCPETSPFTEAQWAALEAGDDHAAQLELWADKARCLVHATALSARDLLLSAEPSSAEAQNFAGRAAEAAGHLLRFQSQAFLNCDCEMGCRLAAGDAEAMNPVCAFGEDQQEVYAGIVGEVRSHSALAASSSTIGERKAHAEHVLQCLSSLSAIDWDGDGTVAPPGKCANDFGLYGRAPSNLLEVVIEQSRSPEE